MYYEDVPEALDYADRGQVVDFRAPFLDRRVADVAAVCRLREELLPGGACDGDAADADVRAALGGDGPTLIAGHSFGGSTAILATQLAARAEGPFAGLQQPSFAGCLLLDAWAYPLSDAVLDAGAPVGETPTLLMQSEQFVDNNEHHVTERFVSATHASAEDPSRLLPFYVQGSRHQSWSDAVFWLPEKAVRTLQIAGEGGVDEVPRDEEGRGADVERERRARRAAPAVRGAAGAACGQLQMQRQYSYFTLRVTYNSGSE